MGAIAKANTANKQLAAKTNPQGLKDFVVKYEAEISKALPKVGITPERFTRLMLSALSATPQLMECTPKSFLGAMMTCAQMGMEPNTPLGQAYLIPYKNYKTGTTECQYQLGYRGLISLAYRSGQIKNIGAQVVYQNDVFEYELGLDPKLVHKPKMDGDRGPAVAYYAFYSTKDGGFGFAVMSKYDVDEHRKRFSKARNSPWDTNYDEMAKKTVLKKALKYAPLSIDMQREMASDEMIKRPDEAQMGGDMLDLQGDYIEVDGIVRGDAYDDDAPAEIPDFPPAEGEEIEYIDPETGEVRK